MRERETGRKAGGMLCDDMGYVHMHCGMSVLCVHSPNQPWENHSDRCANCRWTTCQGGSKERMVKNYIASTSTYYLALKN